MLRQYLCTSTRYSINLMLLMVFLAAQVHVGAMHHLLAEHQHDHHIVDEPMDDQSSTDRLLIGHAMTAEHEHQLSAIVPPQQSYVLIAAPAWQSMPALNLSNPTQPPPRKPPRFI